MKWLELSIQTPPEYVEPLSHIFHRYGHGGVVVEEGGGFNPDEGESPPALAMVTLKTYLPMDASIQWRRSGIDMGVRLVAHVAPVTPLQERVLDEEEWQSSWKEHFHVLHIGRRIVIAPTWREYQPQDSEVVIRLDPGMAFGTGHHPTTRMCLELLEELVRPHMSVLDVGCGSGVLSLAAARLGARSVLGLEIDSVAASVAMENVRGNGLSHVIRVAHGTLPHPEAGSASFDLAAVNISARVVTGLAQEVARAVKPGGSIVTSGFLVATEADVTRRLAEAGATVQRTLSDGDWLALVARVE